jgi:MYXO-CTERM domain-containing protein
MSGLLAGGAAFQVQLSGLGEDNVGNLMVVLEDDDENLAFYTAFDVTSDGLKAIAFESELAGFDRTAVRFMSLYVSSSVAFSGTLSNFTIPAPGALALLGAAGLVGARRRR